MQPRKPKKPRMPQPPRRLRLLQRTQRPLRVHSRAASEELWLAILVTVLNLSTPFVTIPDAFAPRQCSQWVNSVVNRMPWYDLDTPVHARITAMGLGASAGLRLVNYHARRELSTITDRAFAHLTGLHALDMSECSQSTITDKAFSHLLGLHVLSMAGCDQSTIPAGA